MTKILSQLRSILKALGRKSKLTISVALPVPGFLKIEVEYARDLGQPPEPPKDAERHPARPSRRGPFLHVTANRLDPIAA